MSGPNYETDFSLWCEAQAAAIRARAWKTLDVGHLAEEVDDL